MAENIPNLADVRRRRRIWFGSFIVWQVISFSLLITIAAGSAFVASSVSGIFTINGGAVRDIAALAVAICSAILLALQPQQQAQAYRQAWIEIDLAIKSANGVPADLLEALRKGENLIGNVHTEKAATEPEHQARTNR
jgi:hypothetical protein